jgi:hypothetical protein
MEQGAHPERFQLGPPPAAVRFERELVERRAGPDFDRLTRDVGGPLQVSADEAAATKQEAVKTPPWAAAEERRFRERLAEAAKRAKTS